jgi:polyhydroxybutyrate depolymerase
MRLSTMFSAGLAMLFGCGSSTPGSPVEPADAAKIDAGSTIDAATTDFVVLKNLRLSGHAQPFDVYAPKAAKRVVIFLHGGLGKKESSANQLGINKNDIPDEAWLRSQETAFVFPQGSAIAEAPLATTWTNYVMNSGQDDMSFLKALQSALRAGNVHQSLASISKVYVAGHSNGGMMANRLWCEASADFDGFAAFAGPASVVLHPLNGTSRCNPTSPKPYFGMIGANDETIQTTGNWARDVWTINPSLASNASFVNPMLSMRKHSIESRASEPFVLNPWVCRQLGAVEKSQCGAIAPGA